MSYQFFMNRLLLLSAFAIFSISTGYTQTAQARTTANRAVGAVQAAGDQALQAVGAGAPVILAIYRGPGHFDSALAAMAGVEPSSGPVSVVQSEAAPRGGEPAATKVDSQSGSNQPSVQATQPSLPVPALSQPPIPGLSQPPIPTSTRPASPVMQALPSSPPPGDKGPLPPPVLSPIPASQ